MYVRVCVCSKWKKNDKIKGESILALEHWFWGDARAMLSCCIFYFFIQVQAPWMCSVCKRYTYNTCAFLKVHYNNFNNQFINSRKKEKIPQEASRKISSDRKAGKHRSHAKSCWYSVGLPFHPFIPSSTWTFLFPELCALPYNFKK